MSSKTSMERIYAEANEILKQELKEKWGGWTYERLRGAKFFGFTSFYLLKSANFEEFSSSAKVPILLKLAKLDLQKETTIAELVYSCCFRFPKKEAIESLMDLAKQEEDEEKVIERVFEFQNQNGFSCLIALFDMATAYNNTNNLEYSSGPMLIDIEESCRFLIELAKSAKLDLDKVLNHTTKRGDTLYNNASVSSKKITEQLLMETNDNGKKIVKVNSIDHKFQTSFFRVRLKIDF